MKLRTLVFRLAWTGVIVLFMAAFVWWALKPGELPQTPQSITKAKGGTAPNPTTQVINAGEYLA